MFVRIDRLLVPLVVGGLLATGCGNSSSVEAGIAAGDEPQPVSGAPAELPSGDLGPDDVAPGDTALGDPARFGDFPVEPDDGWLIAAEYVGTSFIERSTGAVLDAESTVVQFLGRSQISIASGDCGIGGGPFTLVAGRVTEPELMSDLMMCTPSDQATYDAARAIIEADPEIRADGNRLLLLSDEHRLEMLAADPGVEPIIEDDERFIAVETSVAALDPSRIELASPAFFVIRVTLPDPTTCTGRPPPRASGGRFRSSRSSVTIPAEFSPPADKVAQAFFADAPVASRTGDILEVVGPQGTIRFRRRHGR